MHDCPNCGALCDCDGEDNELATWDCCHECGPEGDLEDEECRCQDCRAVLGSDRFDAALAALDKAGEEEG